MTGAPRIAIVDDDTAILAGVSSLLRSMGYAVALFESAEALVAALPGPGFDCVITDIQMAGMNGLDLQALLVRRYPALPIIVMTAFPEPALRARAMEAGAICFLSKPFDAEELLRCVTRALQG
ncbi:MAG: response regulator [Sphingomonas sp.]|uniref:response regulator transcription factor n=1 Tax=Sphingomonas sp. TaxID=28214 RepID=UPI001B1D68EC|nr:response regulator [Sphingomonas sp.]MBO9623361.1 response regulator [Sphingomonas sp.]